MAVEITATHTSDPFVVGTCRSVAGLEDSIWPRAVRKSVIRSGRERIVERVVFYDAFTARRT